jgi:hypothetical protein
MKSNCYAFGTIVAYIEKNPQQLPIKGGQFARITGRLRLQRSWLRKGGGI